MVFKLTSFDKILQRHSSSASSPDQKSPEIYRHVSTSGLANKDEISHDYHMLPQHEVRIFHVSCYHCRIGNGTTIYQCHVAPYFYAVYRSRAASLGFSLARAQL